jgi:hypothetical protein
MLHFLHTRQWVIARRLVLVAAILFLAYRNYGGRIASWMQPLNEAQRDIVVTKAEFHSSQPGERPAWILNFQNRSSEHTYDQIQLEATYSDSEGRVLQKDTLVVNQVLRPGEERLVASVDSRERGAAVNGYVTVLTAEKVEPSNNK